VPRDTETPGSAAEWIARARSDLVLARIPLPAGGRYEDLCYHAQQAAEKAIKGVYRSHTLPFPYTHNLGLLMDGLRRYGIAIPREVESAAPLTVYAQQTRYPGIAEPITEQERGVVVNAAEAVVAWAERLVAASQP
jgi:HEPN domain-containing protein